MRYALLVVLIWGSVAAQDAPKPPEPMKGTFSNLDKEPPPYVPDEKDVKTAEVRATNARHAYENYVELKAAEQASKANYYDSAARLNNALANRANRW